MGTFNHASTDKDILAADSYFAVVGVTTGFQANAIVTGVHRAVFDQHIAAGIRIDAVGVSRLFGVLEGYTANSQFPTANGV